MAGSVVTATATFAGGAAQSIGVSTGGNTLGNTGTYSGQVVFAGGNNITLPSAPLGRRANNYDIWPERGWRANGDLWNSRFKYDVYLGHRLVL